MRSFVFWPNIDKEISKILQWLCNSRKGTTSEIYPLAKDGQTLVKAAHRFCRSNKGTIFFNSG